MFDIGISELFVIGIVALIVVGPERLPKVARVAGHFFGRAQRYVNTVKADIHREMQLDELKKLQEEMTSTVQGFENSVQSEIAALKAEATQIEAALPKTADIAELEKEVRT